MAYQALYRKWRPQTFADVVGQSAITETLKNALIRQQVSHAFLFAGPRGTGKTSCAKIFAKALNCLDLQDGEPCNQCANCQSANNGSLEDIIEIDAASNNGVDEIRTIRDQVKYAPTQGKYKVYIIDEVHMLSMGAFNALLKTLEEPPEHVVFILATTELQKVPATIISRTQRYRFRRIKQSDILAQLQKILQTEKIEYDESALQVVAQVADGGMRDALSILDQLLAYDTGKINYQDALTVTGFADQKAIEQLCLRLLQGQTDDALAAAKQLLDQGASTRNILTELIELTSQLLLAIKSPADHSQDFLVSGLLDQARVVPQTSLFRLIELANKGLQDLRYTNQQMIPLTVFIVESSQKRQQPAAVSAGGANSAQLAKLQAEIKALNQKIEAQAQKTASVQPVKSQQKLHHHLENKEQVYHVLENATRHDLNTIEAVWPDLVSTLAVSERALADVLKPVAASDQQVVLKCKYELWFERANKDTNLVGRLEAELSKLTQHNYGIVLVADSAWLSTRASFLQTHKDELLAKQAAKEQAAAQPADEQTDPQTAEQVVSQAKALFGDLAHVKDQPNNKEDEDHE
ncbi:MAG: DNA polymerase III subunit gamma/tau [Lactobacillus sp.]|jgi:DNA polymerase-3 subunit gamma/tau|nr:DNA polymerase III subunit gamma/tau [Lactobacillus sp.]MCH3905945.1 DNA polymerase III subunit gamma/tau [Lactobacillus sp.]MCH3990481.1 DNA polymerase III subunit gamma/tau [Lactobacillus sp.]MCH4068804.1 DNA polymerase III subunit gamma/tau [Lactobacillus sp.]MCI1304429.1 DNA polymerase III subunit gamma/tau [Lactobacillus sp.]